MPDLRLPSRPQSVTALWPVPNCTAWWQRHMGVNNLPRVVAWQCTGRESNPRPLDLESDTLTTTPPSHQHHFGVGPFNSRSIDAFLFCTFSLTQLSLPSLRGQVNEYQLVAGRWANYTSSGCKFPTVYMCQKLWKLAGSGQSYGKNYQTYFFWPTLSR